ncbi:MAG: LysR family transcriptional regulator [Hyphomicrobiaceae bacterium]
MTHILDLPPRLLRLLVDLCETSSISRTAENLGISQPAASRGLAQLRDALGDTLLKRSGRGLVVTPSAMRIAPQVRAVLHQIERLPLGVSASPPEMRGIVRIASTDYGATVGLAPVLKSLQDAAPNIAFEVLPLDGKLFQKLLDGRLDLAFYADDPLPPGIEFVELFVEEQVYVVARHHPLARRRKLTRQDIDRFPRLLVTIIGDRYGYVDDRGQGEAQPGLWLPYFTAAPLILGQSDMVMTLPRRSAEKMKDTANLVILKLRPENKPFAYRLLWAKGFSDDPINSWLRNAILSHFNAEVDQEQKP